LDTNGSVNKILYAVDFITNGRIGLRTKGRTEHGRDDFHKGIADAMAVFKEAMETGDLFLMLMCENAFLTKELESATRRDSKAVSSYNTALIEYDDAFNCLEIIKDSARYKDVAAACSHKKPFRKDGLPKDGFVVAMMGHPARIRNSLTMLGLDPDEQRLRELRIKVCRKALELYMQKQAEICTVN
jgi:hypothetical protein